MKIYELKFTVRHGDYCFDKMYLYEAENDDDANRLAHKWCCDFYGASGVQEEPELYTFHAGCIAIRIGSVKEVIDVEIWKDEQYENAFIRNI
jgi:hypothetical protein